MVRVVITPQERYPDMEVVRTDDEYGMLGYTEEQAEEMPDELYARYVAARDEYDAVQLILRWRPAPAPPLPE